MKNHLHSECARQDQWYIKTLDNNPKILASIYSEEQRKEIDRLISEGYLPHHSSVGIGNPTKAHWTVNNYHGKFGYGFKMITTSTLSNHFNHITYFIKQPS